MTENLEQRTAENPIEEKQPTAQEQFICDQILTLKEQGLFGVYRYAAEIGIDVKRLRRVAREYGLEIPRGRHNAKGDAPATKESLGITYSEPDAVSLHEVFSNVRRGVEEPVAAYYVRTGMSNTQAHRSKYPRR